MNIGNKIGENKMIKKELMLAKTAREIVNNKINEKQIIEVWNKIVDDIEDAVADGYHSFYYNKILPSYITQELRNLGYTVENNYEENICYIQWGNPWGRSKILRDEKTFFGGGCGL